MTETTETPVPQFEEIQVGQSKEVPAKMTIYGVPKIGKTTFAAQFDDPFFINIEGGLDYLDKKVRSTPHLKTYDEVTGWLRHIYENDDFKAGTIIVDSLDWLEEYAQHRIVKQHGGKSLNDNSYKPFSYYAGYNTAADDTIKLIGWLDAIYKKKGIKTLLICHSVVKDVDLPNKDKFGKYQLKTTKRLAAKVMEWSDLILFADYSFFVDKDGKTSEQKRVLLAGGSAAFEGGGRMNLNKEIPLDYNELVKEITK